MTFPACTSVYGYAPFMPGDFPQGLAAVKKYWIKSDLFARLHSLTFDADRTFYGPIVAYDVEKKQLYPTGYILLNPKQFSLGAHELSAL